MPKKKDLIRMRDVPKIVYELTGVTRCRESIYIWARVGVRGYTNEPLKLKTTKRMGQLYTTEKWIEEFIRSM